MGKKGNQRSWKGAGKNARTRKDGDADTSKEDVRVGKREETPAEQLDTGEAEEKARIVQGGESDIREQEDEAGVPQSVKQLAETVDALSLQDESYDGGGVPGPLGKTTPEVAKQGAYEDLPALDTSEQVLHSIEAIPRHADQDKEFYVRYYFGYKGKDERFEGDDYFLLRDDGALR